MKCEKHVWSAILGQFMCRPGRYLLVCEKCGMGKAIKVEMPNDPVDIIPDLKQAND